MFNCSKSTIIIPALVVAARVQYPSSVCVCVCVSECPTFSIDTATYAP